MSEKTTVTVSTGAEGRSNLPRESASMLPARESGPTPAVTRSSDVPVSRSETTVHVHGP